MDGEREQRRARVAWAALFVLAVASGLSCATSRPPAVDEPPREDEAAQPMEVELGASTLGTAEAECNVAHGQVELRLRSTCSTPGPLWLTFRHGEPFESDWRRGPIRHDQPVKQGEWKTIRVDVPSDLPGGMRVLAVEVRARCVADAGVMVLERGDAKCRL
jgi:hypothetical protein